MIKKNSDSKKTGISRRGFLAKSTLSAAAIIGTGCTLNAGENKTTDKRTANFREKLLACLGGPWPEPCDLGPILRKTIRKEGYRIESITYQAEPGDNVPALLLIPDGVDAKNPAPAVSVWHQHAGKWNLGKSEPAGLAGDPMHHTGLALVKQGYVVLCPDALCFEERRNPHLKDGEYERFEFLRYVVAGKSMAWKNILDMTRAIDYLCSRPEVQKENIGCYGHSMGATHTWLVGPWEPRIKCLVANCCMPTYAAIHRTGLVHCFPNYIPGIYQFGDTPDIVSLIAPKPLHLNFGDKDMGSPIDEVRQGIKTIAKTYKSLNAEDNFSFFIEKDTGHVLSQQMWAKASNWLNKHLRS